MRKLYLIRHGQASAGTDNYDRLSTLGQKQARLLGDAWRQREFPVCAAWSGTLQRQQHTAQLALEHAQHDVELGTIPALNEYDHGVIDRLFGCGSKSDDPESMTFERYSEIMARWRDADETVLKGSESWQTFLKRGWHAVKHAADHTPNTKSLCFFTSGGVISAILNQIVDLDFDRTLDTIWHTRNASITTIGYDGARARLLDFNTVSHLDSHFDHSLITLI